MIRLKVHLQLAARHWTQRELVARSGISSQTVHRLTMETADGIRLETLDTLCRVLQCRVEDLLEYIPDEEVTQRMPWSEKPK